MATNPRKLRLWQRQLPFLLAVLTVLVLDQVSKELIRANFLPGESVPAQGWFRLTRVLNTGASFGLFQGKNMTLAVTGAIGILAIVLYYKLLSSRGPLLRVALGLQLGGAIGNLIDRFRLGYVTDFFDVGIWPVFNVADSALVVGIVLAIALTIRSETPRPRSGDTPAGTPS